MDKFISIILIIITTMSTAHSQEYTLNPVETRKCDWVDTAIAAGTTVTTATLVGVTAIANVATTAGGVVGYTAALSAPVFMSTTLPGIAVGTVIFGTIIGLPAWGLSCYLRN